MNLHRKTRKLAERIPAFRAIQNDLSSQARERALRWQAHADAADARARLADIVRRWPRQADSSPSRPIFIFAAGWRSDSTLVQRMLTSVDDVIFPSFDHLIRAHGAFFTELFESPAKAMGKPRLGFKEVRLTSELALYVKQLYPGTRFVFLYRNPVDAWLSFHSYIKADDAAWPERRIVSARDFGALWCEMVADFSENHKAVGGLLIRYENLLVDRSVHRMLCDYVEADIRSVETFDVIRGRHSRHGWQGRPPTSYRQGSRHPERSGFRTRHGRPSEA